MNTITFIMIATIVVYLLGMLAIGFIFSKNNNDSTDFYLGGRKMGPLVTAMSAEASDMSSWLLMGIPGLAYFSGIAEPSWTAIGLGIGTWLNWLLVSRKLRRYSSNINAITIPEFYSKRFHDKKNVLNAIAALVIIVFFIPYTASGFKACGTLFNSLFGVDYTVAMIISAIVIVSYTIMGGFKAVSTTDLVQSIVMTIALAVVLGFGIHVAGGMGAVISNAKEMPGYLTMFASHVRETNSSTPYSALTIASTLAWGLGYFGMPHILVRFMAIEDEKKLVLSRRIATIWVVIAMFVAVLIGLVGYGMTCAGAVEFLDSPSRAEEIIIKIANLISQHGILAAIVAGLILAGILAATMSTADSQMLAAASSVSQNIIQDFFKVKLDEKKAQSKCKRWQAIAESAAKQSKRTVIPQIQMPLSWKQALEEAKELDVVLVPYENERGMEATREIFRSIPEGASIGVMIGPEGGFSPEEIAQLDKDMHRISLGRRILRTETAGMATLSMLIYELDI